MVPVTNISTIYVKLYIPLELQLKVAKIKQFL